MELYLGRVYSKAELTAAPRYLSIGADFALVPSRDGPATSKSGPKGAVGAGSRLGGLKEAHATMHMCLR